MNRDEKQRITENLVFITENTKDIRRLAINLVAVGLLSNGDKQTIEKIPDEAEKVYYLYHEVMKTGRYADLVSILDETGNELIANKLRTLPSYEQNQQKNVSQQPAGHASPGLNAFQVSRSGVTEILSILSEYPSLEEVWVDVIARKLLSDATYGNLRKNGVHSVIVMRTLDAWRDDKAKDATLQNLAKIIRPHNQVAAVALLDSAIKIRDA